MENDPSETGAADFPRFPCPKCSRKLPASGVVRIDGGPELPVYQCDECLVMSRYLDMEIALTFAVENGRAINPTDPDEPL